MNCSSFFASIPRAWPLVMLVLLVGALAPLRADWINLTGAESSRNIAEIYVLEDHVRLVLEVYIGDLKTFEEVLPDELLDQAGGVSKRARAGEKDRLRHFSESVFQFVTRSGGRLPAKLLRAELRERTDREKAYAGMMGSARKRSFVKPPADKRVIYAELHYPFSRATGAASANPRELVIIPPLDENGSARVNLGFIAYHKSVPITDFRYLTTAERLLLDWSDPWYSRFENPKIKRHHESALMSFLYVEPYEVRHEVLTRVEDISSWMALGLRGDTFIETDELEPLKQRVGEFLLTKNPVLVDGKALKPILDRSAFMTIGLGGLQLIEKPQRLEISTAIVGVIFAYIIDGLPQKATVEWELFTDRIEKVPAISIDPAGAIPTVVDRIDNVHTWTNDLRTYRVPTVERVAVDDALTTMELPLGSILCLVGMVPLVLRLRSNVKASRPRLLVAIGCAAFLVASLILYPFARVSIGKPAVFVSQLPDDTARVALQDLLKNVYRAFDFRTEENVYDKLAISISGDLLADIYLQSRRSFEIKKAGGAQAKVKHLQVLEATVENSHSGSLTYDLRAKWTALGTVGHWGHTHVRKNFYDAVVTMDGSTGRWKIAALELIEEKRVEPTRRPRGAGS